MDPYRASDVPASRSPWWPRLFTGLLVLVEVALTAFAALASYAAFTLGRCWTVSNIFVPGSPRDRLDEVGVALAVYIGVPAVGITLEVGGVGWVWLRGDPGLYRPLKRLVAATWGVGLVSLLAAIAFALTCAGNLNFQSAVPQTPRTSGAAPRRV